ncbi:CERK [Mytilus edulis]|uniref:CERK n=1 Tax=Mytilus edulis TaxID=6550 RepID=A0A8S3V9I8_MYTED|nr:CERK [Mytilus edulis]
MLYLNDNRVNVSLEGGVMTVASEENNLLASIEIRYLLKSVLERSNLTVHYMIQKKNMKLKVKNLVLRGDEEDAQMLHKDIEHILKVTKKQKEPTDILKNYNLSNIDGIVTVGGDGLYCECMNGLIARVQRDNNVNVNCHNTDIVSASLPIGIIPAGSGNVIVQYLHGTKCASTAVLHILLGGNVESNVCSVHEGGKLLSYSALILGFGLFGNIMHDCEKFRWMGPLRYNVVPVASMLKRREIDVEIEYYSANKGKATKRIRGIGKQISLPNGFMTSSCKSKIQRTYSTPGVLDSSDVQVSENTKTLQKDFYLNCDGEVIRLSEPEFDVKLHKKAVRIFGYASG